MNGKMTLSELQWDEVWAAFDTCVPLNPAARETYLNEVCQGKPWLREEVESLLQSDTHRLEAPLVDRVASGRTPRTSNLRWKPEALGRYQLLHLLGQGGMAQVFLSKMVGPNGFEKVVAVKRMLPEYTTHFESNALFLQEAKLSAQLNHPGIVQVYDYAEHEGTYFLAMEYINGINLADLLKHLKQTKVGLPTELGILIVLKAAEALEYAHEFRDDATGRQFGIIHRDVSPKNIMVGFDGVVKVVDFGIAKALAAGQTDKTVNLRGTVGYCSPEQMTGKAIDSGSDVFSLCTVLYELLAGVPLFDGKDFFSTQALVQDAEFIRRQLDGLDIDRELRTILDDGLRHAPKSRIASGQLRAQLGKYVATKFSYDQTPELKAFLMGHFKEEILTRRKLLKEAASVDLGEAPPAPREKPMKFFVMAGVAALIATFSAAMLLRERSEPTIIDDTKASARQPQSSGTPQIRVCKQEIETHCPLNNFREILVCLAKKDSSLSAPCRRFLTSRTCAFDIVRLCPEMSPRDVNGCLEVKKQSLSKSCQQKLGLE